MIVLGPSIRPYPRNKEDNLIYRESLFEACEKDPGLQRAVNGICADDIFFWIDCFGWTFDPRKDPRTIPFVLYDEFQRAYIKDVFEAVVKQHDLLTEKSRDMGVSWMVLCVFMHQWLFKPGCSFRIGSRKEEEVDRPASIDTLFEKMRFYLKRLPNWMLPEGFEWRKHSSYMKLANPMMESVIVGEATNENFGRGARDTAILMDEFAVWECDAAAWTSCADTTKCRLPVSTPNGAGNKFAALAMGTKEKIKKHTLHWTLHPEKAKGAYYTRSGDSIKIEACHEAFKHWKMGTEVRSPWYDAEELRRTARDMAQEINISYLESGSPFFTIKALERQKKWELYKRQRITDRIPYGKYIKAKLVEVDRKIEIRDAETGWLKVFELPETGRQYAIGADSSEGLPKGDEATFVVREKITRNVVATCNGMYAPEELAWLVYLAAMFYKDADVAPENNNHGYTTCKEVEELGVKLYYTRKDEVVGSTQVETPKRGWTTTVKSRALMLDQMAKEVDHETAELRDPDLIDQCYTFIQNDKGKPEAVGEFLDDMIIAHAICGQVMKDLPFKKKSHRAGLQKERMIEAKRAKNAGFSYGRT